MATRSALSFLVLPFLVLLAACGDDDAVADSGADSSEDAAEVGGSDAAEDGGSDAAEDGGSDAAEDAGNDAAEDTGTDAEADTSVDAGLPPEVDAGPDQITLARHRITLAGVATDPEGGSLTLSWSLVSGPPVELDDEASPTPSFWIRYGGTYVLRLTADDGGNVVTDDVEIQAHNINGGDHTVALKPDGTLWAWGDNSRGELGDGTLDNHSTPARVCDEDATDCDTDPLDDVIAISTGRSHTLALKADGTVWAWGDNGTGQLGIGDFEVTERTTPTQVCAVGETAPCEEFLTGVIDIASGYVHSTALLADGRVVTWGDNAYGELGNDDLGSDSASPVEVCDEGATAPCSMASGNVLTDVERLAAGGDGHTLALRDGELWAWGANKNGQTGPGYVTNSQATPAHVCSAGGTDPCTGFLSNIVEMDAWSSHSLAVTTSGSTFGWGSNEYGQLSSIVPTVADCQSSPCYHSPVEVCRSGNDPCTAGLFPVTMIAAGRRWSVALVNGQVWTWGDNEEGKLGHGHAADDSIGRVCAAPPDGCGEYLSDIVGVTTGNYHGLALAADGTLYAWGSNDYGQVSSDVPTDHPVPVVVVGY